MPRTDAAPPRPLPPGSGGWARRLAPFVLAHRRPAAFSLAAALVGQGLAALAPAIQRIVVDDALLSDRRSSAPWLVGLVAITVVAFALAFVRRWYGGRVSLAVQYDLRNAIFERLQRLDFAGHDRLHTGQIVARATTDLGLLQMLLSFLPLVLGNLVLIVVAVVVMATLSLPLTVVTVAVLAVLWLVAVRMRRTVFPASWDAQQRAGEVAGVVDEAVNGVRVVKAFGQEERELERLGAASRRLYASRARLVRIQARYTPTLAAVPALAQVAVLGLGGHLALRGDLSIGAFLAFAAYLTQLVAPIRLLAILVAVAQQTRAGGERILDILDVNPGITERDDAPDLPVGPGAVSCRGVRFGYTASTPVLDGFDLDVAPGEVVALFGASGSGKSTVAALLPRFYDVAAGSITIDGVDVRDVTLASLRRRVGVVFEEAFLFSDTIAANIAYGRPDATDAEVRRAAVLAGAADFVDDLPEGYDTVVGERGVSLSGGQRQRIALARALLGDPSVLVLDDATSAVDAGTEASIFAQLRPVLAGRTTLLVAHRRSTLQLADRIVVVDAGRVVEQGSHDDLWERCPRYRELLGHVDPTTSTVTAADVPPPAGTVTAAAWPEPTGDLPRASAEPGRPGAGIGGPGHGHGMMLSATPDLLAALAALPPATEDPSVDEVAATAPPREGAGFGVRTLVAPWRRLLALGLLAVVAEALLGLTGPLLLRVGIDQGVGESRPGLLWAATAVLAAAVGASWVVSHLGALLTGRTAERMLHELRLRIFAQLQRLGIDYYERELAGRIMTRMTTDVEALSQLVQTGLVTLLVGVATGVGVFVFLVVLSPPLALVAALSLPPLVLATRAYQRRASMAYDRAREAIAEVNANLQENLSGVRVAQAHGREDRNRGHFADLNRAYLGHRLGAQRLVSLYFPFVALLASCTTAAVLGAGDVLVARGTVTAGVVVAFVLYLDLFFAPVQQVSQVFDTWQQAQASVRRIDELLALRTVVPSPLDPRAVPEPLGVIRLEDVRFRYPGDGVEERSEALRGVDIELRPGEHVAIVGPTGAGKSTVVRLLARFADPTAGRVTVSGIDLTELDPGAYRRHIGYVPQEAFLFTGSIRDNIAYGRPDATDAEVEAAARSIGAHGFVAALPDGYRTAVTERGRSLSAGQRQLLALARARLVDPDLLLLDEATSNLDLAAEGRVREALDVLRRGRTTVTVAHRLPTAAQADRIIVLVDGRVAETGTHAELVAADGVYAELWAAFSAGETGGEPVSAATGPRPEV